MNTTTTLAQRLVQARIMRELSQEVLARQVGLTQQGYSDLERGMAKRSTRIGSLAHALGVSAYWLETGLGKQDDTDGLSREERTLIHALRQMEPARRKGFMAFIAAEKSK